MKLKLRIACVALLAAAAAPAWALQLGQIQVKSALDQPLVAAIPLHPKNLTELQGLTVGLAPAVDYAHAGLKLTPTDRTLQFRVITDNNGQKLILVTSSQPITDPYLDFLVEVNTRQGRQVREFVVLLNPVIAAPAPVVQTAPVASTPAAAPAGQTAPIASASEVPSVAQPAQLPAESAFPQPAVPPPAPERAVSPPPAAAAPQSSARQPAVKPAPKPAASTQKKAAEALSSSSRRSAVKPAPKPHRVSKTTRHAAPTRKAAAPSPAAPPPATPSAATVRVSPGDTLYRIAQQQMQGNRSGINQMMVALQTANPDAFFKDNIDNLKAGAILRIPTRDEIDQTSVAEANAEVRRQYESWRASRPHPATLIEGTAAQAAANAAPKSTPTAPASDHLTLTPPTGNGGAANNRPGVAGGTGNETVTGLQQELQNDRGALISLNQSNADLESRVRSLKDISGKTSKLLSLKDSTIAGLQRKLAQMQSGKTGAAGGSSVAATAGGAGASGSATKAAAPAGKSAAPPSVKPVAGKPGASGAAWYERPLAWVIAGLVVLALILFGLLRRRRGGAAAATAKAPLPNPDDIVPLASVADDEASLQAKLGEDPTNLETHLALCKLYYARGDRDGFVAAAGAMHAHVGKPDGVKWREVVQMGEALSPDLPFALAESHDDPYGIAALREPEGADAAAVPAAPATRQPEAIVEPDVIANEPFEPAHAESGLEHEVAVADQHEPEFADDPVDTKLDLARAYLDMGDPVGARAMLEEVVEEGSQAQKDEAKRLLADVTS
ncbi:MAG TPA: FimV/HubP family polar landmark protein [Rhodanobacteraceae bacterium]|nr:FimV/HubP family polar landmark protein [Rhodanobacteraceae bacterium]